MKRSSLAVVALGALLLGIVLGVVSAPDAGAAQLGGNSELAPLPPLTQQPDPKQVALGRLLFFPQ